MVLVTHGLSQELQLRGAAWPGAAPSLLHKLAPALVVPGFGPCPCAGSPRSASHRAQLSRHAVRQDSAPSLRRSGTAGCRAARSSSLLGVGSNTHKRHTWCTQGGPLVWDCTRSCMRGRAAVELSVRTAQSEGRALNQAEASQGAEAVAGG